MTLDEARAQISEHRSLFEAAAAREPEWPAGEFAGRGIVICAGGGRYLPCAWVCIQLLRRAGCALPIELWHLGAKEMPAKFRLLIEPLGVRCVDAEEMRQRHPVRILNGWELKCYALLWSRFAEVMLLDADNCPLRDPTYLFAAPEYLAAGAVFWPDCGRLPWQRESWELCGMEYRDEPEFESGQIVIDKARCWRALHLAMHLNEHSDFYYRFMHGDKETFHLAWRRLGQDYAMPRRAVSRLRHTMVQHDFEGVRLFQHRNMDKWRLDRENEAVPGFALEEECRGYLRELALVWHRPAPGIGRWHAVGWDAARQAAAVELTELPWMYHRVGHDHRAMSFRPDGRVGLGTAAREVYWDLRTRDGTAELVLSGQDAATCTLRRREDGTWRGAWLAFERAPVEITPQAARTGRPPTREGHPSTLAETMPRLIHQIWLGGQPLPEEGRRFADGWKERHPSWHYQLWTERELEGVHLELAPLIAEAENVAMRADLLRYELLHRYGGLYVDTDFECLRPLDELLREVDAEVFAGFEPATVTHRWSVSNALLGALPGAAFLAHLMAQAPASIARHRAERAWHRQEYIARAVGPAFLTRCAAECPEITVFPQPLLYPKRGEQKNAYARHHFRGLWRGQKDLPAARPVSFA